MYKRNLPRTRNTIRTCNNVYAYTETTDVMIRLDKYRYLFRSSRMHAAIDKNTLRIRRSFFLNRSTTIVVYVKWKVFCFWPHVNFKPLENVLILILFTRIRVWRLRSTLANTTFVRHFDETKPNKYQFKDLIVLQP